VRAFHRDAAPQLKAAGALALYRISTPPRKAGGARATRAVLLCLLDGTRTYAYLGGFDPALARYSPGLLLYRHAIGETLARGAREFDFLRGDEHYKYDFGPVDRPTLRLVVRRRGLRGALARSIGRAERSLERLGGRLRNALWGQPRAPRHRVPDSGAVPEGRR
jgi:CelD/BcsL family acetyltransferase involved in cellulose biosynthesis